MSGRRPVPAWQPLAESVAVVLLIAAGQVALHLALPGGYAIDLATLNIDLRVIELRRVRGEKFFDRAVLDRRQNVLDLGTDELVAGKPEVMCAHLVAVAHDAALANRQQRLGDAQAAEQYYDSAEQCLQAEDVAQTVLYALQQPKHVEIAQLVVLPVS